MCITPVLGETVNLQGGSVDIDVQDKVTNWKVTGNPVWDVQEFNVGQGSIYNINGLGAGASLALLVNGGKASNIFGTMNLSNLDFILQNIVYDSVGKAISTVSPRDADPVTPSLITTPKPRVRAPA